MKTQLWVVIVNFRTADLVIDCLRSLAPQVPALAGGLVLVADNDSGDGSAQKISTAIAGEAWHDWARVLPLARNGGFAFGNNAGIREALRGGASSVMLLNPDTIVHDGALESLLGFMTAHPRAGIVGSLLENPGGGVDCSAHRVHSPLGELEGSARLGLLSRLLRDWCVSPPLQREAHQCDWVSGAAMLIRREVLEQVGPMDEGYFLYFEEVDLCCRVKRTGWEIWYVPQSRVLHLEGASTGIGVMARRRPSYWYNSRRRFFVKHYGVAGLLAADALWVVGRLSFLARRVLRLGGQDGHDPKWFMVDLLWGDLMAVLTGKAWKISGQFSDLAGSPQVRSR